MVLPPWGRNCPPAFNPNTTDYAICLHRANTWCAGAHFDAAGDIRFALEVLGDSGTVIAIIEWLTTRYSIVAKVVEFLGKLSSHYSKFVGDCIGVWSRGAPLNFGSCKDKHGIYWQAHFIDPHHYEWHLYNTYTKQYMVEPDNHLSDDEWIRSDPIKSGEWYTWAEYAPSSSQPAR